MEWLEFNRWSPEVERDLALQSSWLHSLVGASHAPSKSERAEERSHRLQNLLQQYRPTNPWGHPVAEA